MRRHAVIAAIALITSAGALEAADPLPSWNDTGPKTVAGEGARFALIVHHTDAVREYAYDRDSSIGRLDKALDVARERHWTVVDMKNDWKVIYP